jgi:hypothetical protein
MESVNVWAIITGNLTFAAVNVLQAVQWTLHHSHCSQSHSVIECDVSRGASDAALASVRHVVTAPVNSVLLAGYSKATAVTGEKDENYSLYMDILHSDGSQTYGIHAKFQTGTHDWEYSETVFTSHKPFKELHVYLLCRAEHTGRVQFKDISLRFATEQ